MTQIFPFLDHPGPIPFAHRGGAGERVQNSLAAFQYAYDLGYRYFETDARATADGVALAFHDPLLGRLTDRSGLVSRLPYAEVAKARVAGAEPIPPLADLIAAFPDVRVNIDVKSVAAIGPVVEVIKRTRSLERVCVASFSDRRLAAVRAALGPQLCTSIGPIGVLGLRSAAYSRRLLRLAPRAIPCVQVPSRMGPVTVVDKAFVATAHALGMHVHVWTIDDPDDMNRLLDLGVDGIMTDQVRVLRGVLLDRGRWVPAT